ncbi:MAG: alpha-1,2-fucosyltransferase [Bacteroidia bacterium]
MIIVKLMGGLGNQLFQYAVGRCLSQLHNTELRLDRSYLDADPNGAYTRRDYELGVFTIDPVFATAEDTKPFLRKSKNKVIRTLSRKLPILFDKLYIAERGHAFHKEFMSYPENTYLDGFWQSELYFKLAEDTIRKDLQFKTPAQGLNAEYLQKIKNTNSVSLHVRRADYISDSATNTYHGTCSIDYYKQAVELIGEKNPDLVLYVFSDDIPWCMENLRLEFPHHYISHNSGKNSFEDLRLMSNCRHHIIANSSFSWWGAWLDGNKDKTVIAPERWFTQAINPDIYPEIWIRI